MEEGSAKNQYLVTCTLLLVTASLGAALGWPSPSIPILQSSNTPLPSGPLSMDQMSWVASLISPGSIFGTALYGWIMEKYGRRIACFSIALPQIISWVLIIFAQNERYLYLSRFNAGIGGGGAFCVFPIFITEISEPKIRGFLGSLLVLSCNVGVLLVFIAGAYLKYVLVPWVFLPLPIIFLVLMSFFPETPVYLAKQKLDKESEDSLRFYRGLRSGISPENFQEELKALKDLVSDDKLVKEEMVESNALSWKDFEPPSVRRALILSIGLVILNQWSGSSTMMVYTSIIFKKAGSSLDPNLSAIIVSIIQILGSYASSLLVERSGRKFLMATSAFGNFIGLAILGLYCLCERCGVDVTSWKIIPLLSFCFMIFAANIGILTIPFLIMAEILPQKIKAAVTTILMMFLFFLAFITIKSLPIMMVKLGMDGTMFIFSAASILGAFFLLIHQPETKGRTLAEISKLFEKK